MPILEGMWLDMCYNTSDLEREAFIAFFEIRFYSLSQTVTTRKVYF